MDADKLKKMHEGMSKVLSDGKAFNAIVNKIYDAVQKAKDGDYSVEDMAKGFEGAPMGAMINKEMLEKLFKGLTSDKAKSATKEEIAKGLRERLEEGKAKLEAAMKK